MVEVSRNKQRINWNRLNFDLFRFKQQKICCFEESLAKLSNGRLQKVIAAFSVVILKLFFFQIRILLDSYF
jgi:hypothetical protein